MTAEQRAEAVATEIQAKDYPDADALALITDAIRAAESDARREALEDAAKANCWGCKEGHRLGPAEAPDWDRKHYTDETDGSFIAHCSSTEILALLSGAAGTAKEGG